MDKEKLRSGWPELVRHMRVVGYSESYVRGVEHLVGRLVGDLDEIDGWEAAEEWIVSLWGSGQTAYHARILLGHVRRFCDEGTLPRTGAWEARRGPSVRDCLCHGFAEVIDAYEASSAATGKSESSVRCEVSNAASFFARLERMGRSCPSEVSEEDVLSVLTGADGGPAFSAAYVRHVKAVVVGAGGCAHIASWLPVPKSWRKVVDVLSRDEREKVRDALHDASSGMGQRDRAIGCLLFFTGMRACDVAGLRLDAIDWRHDAIRTVQRKTSAPLVLPLVAQVGNAIMDYLEGERGPSGEPYVFLSTAWPYGPLSPSGVRRVARMVLKSSGVRAEGEGETGSHVFRRTLATAMMGAGVDRSVIAATLGHASPSTSERYMAADIDGLRECALDVSAFGPREGVTS